MDTSRTPIDRPSLHDTIVNRVRTMVYDGDLKPGDKVPERLLCETPHAVA